MTVLTSVRSKKTSEPEYRGRRNPVLLMLVFLLTGAAFWYHFENRFAAIERDRSLSDAHKLLRSEERRQILALRALLREKWGLLLQVRLDDASLPSGLPSNGVFVGMRTDTKTPEVVVHLPALLEKAIGTEYAARMESEIRGCVRKNAVGECLDAALLDLAVALEGGGESGRHALDEPEPQLSATGRIDDNATGIATGIANEPGRLDSNSTGEVRGPVKPSAPPF